MIYLSGTIQRIPAEYRERFGYMVNVNRPMGMELQAVQRVWMLDNGAFGDRFNEARWRQRMERLQAHRLTCIAAIVPDTLCDHADTLRKWSMYAHLVRTAGYKTAFATQDGATIHNLPWDEIDVLFIGGRDRHRALEAWPLIYEARRRNIWVHVGRINTPKSLVRWKSVDSVDGNHFVFDNSPRCIERMLWTIARCSPSSYIPQWSQPPTSSSL